MKDETIAAGTAALVAAAVLGVGLVVVNLNAGTPDHGTIDWPSATFPALGVTTCAQCDMLLDGAAAQRFDITPPAVPGYATVRACGTPEKAKAGPDVAHAKVLLGLKAFGCADVPWQQPWPMIEWWASGTKGDPSTCSCSDGVACHMVAGGKLALKGRTFPAGTVAGGGCVPKPCVELAGAADSMPVACR